jgi:large subunit ribosomal protein L25
MPQTMTIPVQIREKVGKEAARKVRQRGRIPGIVYGPGRTPVPIELDPRPIVHLLEQGAAENTLLELRTDDNQRWLCLLKDYQLDPVRDTLLHADFYAVRADVALTLRVPIRLIGEPPALKAGAVLQFLVREHEVECLPKDIPEVIQVDISSLELGDFVQVRDLKLPPGVRAVEDPDAIIVTLTAAEEYVEEAATPALAETPEPEVIRRGKTEEEEE